MLFLIIATTTANFVSGCLLYRSVQSDLVAVQTLIQKYGVDFWLLDREAFTLEYVANNTWLKQYQPAS